MPSYNTEGKSKEDLALVAQLAGLLTPEQAGEMDRDGLISLLEQENQKADSEAKAVLEDSTGTAAKAEAKPGDETAEASEEKPKKTTRRRTTKAAAEKKTATKTRKPRTTKKKTAEVETEPETKADAADAAETAESAEEKPKKTTRRKTATTKTTSKKATTKKSTAKKSTAEAADSKVPEDEPEAPKPESAPDLSDAQSPEAAEAAVDQDAKPEKASQPTKAETAADRADDRPRKPGRPAQRRTRIIGSPSQDSDKRNQRNTPQPKTPRGDRKPAEAGTQAATAHTNVETGDVQTGILEIMPDGYGFLRKENYLQGNKDIYVPPQYIRRFGLRAGDQVTGPVKLQRENDRYQALLYIKEVNGMPPEKMQRRPHFDRLTPIYPDERFVLETVRNELSTRIIDLIAPIGKGQRGMIVSPPKAGKTILLQKIANAISINNPDSKLIVLLIDERPEEVTDMQRSINGEVVYSTFDKTPENHTKVTELVLERAMRLVELGQDVVILMDSMTRLARAYNLSINPTGRTLSGGLDPGALYGPKRFFGAARNIENGGSLTIIATSLIETGSRMDEVIFEEFKGTGNMEVYLDRKMSEKRIFPAIDINKSSTRREELLMSTKELDSVWTIRKAFGQLDTTAVTETIINLLLKTTSNEHFISSVNVSFNDKNVFDAMRGQRPSDSSQNGRSNNGGR